ncbi:MAG: GMC oxidoreductase [Melioribacteraceae bacterium]|jgi:cholesterol oxidase|nr:GMC oxidoreductase [Melioribacteraceae bacterium]
MKSFDYDFIIIGSGFGGSVSALRLSEKGYKVLVIEKGKNFNATDFPNSNWNVKKWLWMPFLRFFGCFKLTFFRHVTILSGVGVGGGSLVYANTLPIPKDDFFKSKSWSDLLDWKTELNPFYKIASQMLGVAKNPHYEYGDNALKQIAESNNIADKFELTDVGVFFGKADETVPDPYFNGEGPERAGCNFCGGCMVGCRYNAKNSLDKNYLHLAKGNGAEIISESEVYDIKTIGNEDGTDGYVVKFKDSTKLIKKRKEFRTSGVVYSGGVLGTIPLLIKLKKTSLPNLSQMIGRNIRTNSESLLGVTTTKPEVDFSKGIAITSILHTDEHSHIEPVRYPSGSGFWRLQMVPMLDGKYWFTRLTKVFYELVRHPVKWSKLYLVKDWAKKTQILLFMQTINSTLKFENGFFRMKTKLDVGEAPTAFMPKSRELVKQFSEIVGGTPGALLTETIFGIPTTAHILGGATMGKSNSDGVIDKENKVFGYNNMFICDGSMISANPGVNPSLTITAISEYAMDKIPTKII